MPLAPPEQKQEPFADPLALYGPHQWQYLFGSLVYFIKSPIGTSNALAISAQQNAANPDRILASESSGA
jgi:hypothetical protein